jgi:hypothetical protein
LKFDITRIQFVTITLHDIGVSIIVDGMCSVAIACQMFAVLDHLFSELRNESVEVQDHTADRLSGSCS